MEPRAPDAIDVCIGRRVRARRRQLNLTLQQLAATLGVGFQQVQKYETGANRMSAGTLFQIAVALGTAVDHFFQDIPDERARPKR
jgi:transcriptional regulator with XRE-family HTH domain